MSSKFGSPKQPLSLNRSRRRFLKAAGIALGASIVACSGLSYVIQPKPPQIDTPEVSFGKEDPMRQRWLVAYATSAGSTVGVAAAIGETLGARGFAVDVKPIKSRPQIEGYQSVVIGSAVHGARWLPEAMAFVQDNRTALNRVPVALFCVHIMNLGTDEKSRQNQRAYLNTVRSLLTPLDEAYFAGTGMDSASPSGLERWLGGMFNIPEGDRRDWTSIRGWAAALNLPPAAAGSASASQVRTRV